MTAFRLITTPTAAAVELVTGFALLAAPLLLGVAPAGAIPVMAVGALVVGLALAKAVQSVPIGAQHDYDWGLVTGLALAAGGLGLAGEPVAMLLLVSAALVQLALNLVTRYSSA